MQKTVLGTTDSVAELARRLSNCSAIKRYDSEEHNEAWALADGFSDLEGAFRTILDQQLPKLLDPEVKCEALVDLLQDIGEEFRTILWHIQYPKFYCYLHADAEKGDPTDESNPGR